MVVGVAVAARVAYWVLATPKYLPQSDAAQYSELAYNVAHGNGFASRFPQFEVHATAFRPPLYPFLLGAAFRLFGSQVVVGRILNLLLGVLVVVLTERLGRRLGGPQVGLIAALLVALYPALIVNDVTLLTEPLSLVFLLATVLALLASRPWLAGLWCGFLILTRPSAQGLAVVVLGWAIWSLGWRSAVRLVAIAGLVVCPWLVRNWVQLGSPVLVTSNGFNLAAMYSPEARVSHGFVDSTKDPRFASITLTRFDEVKWQAALQKIATDSLKSHPEQVVPVFTRNLVAYFEIRPSFGQLAEELDGRNLTVTSLSLPFFYAVTIFGLLGLWLERRRRGIILLLLIASYFTMASLLVVAPPRLRAPFDLICCLAAPFAIQHLYVWNTRRKAGLLTTPSPDPPTTLRPTPPPTHSRGHSTRA